jgi:hypothetical protein
MHDAIVEAMKDQDSFKKGKASSPAYLGSNDERIIHADLSVRLAFAFGGPEGQNPGEIRLAKASGAPFVHIDCMDGRFVPNVAYDESFREKYHAQDLVNDVHIMIEKPWLFAGLRRKRRRHFDLPSRGLPR